MRLYQRDSHLEYARLALAEGDRTGAGEHFEAARALVNETGYHLRDPDIQDLGKALGPGTNPK
ncbi:MAG: hypothetical protein ACR2Q4_20185 [Geminicoccaceae bacterium]